jgi:hypothetical protein
MADFNVPAALVAGVAGFFVGGLWYSKGVFGSVWCRANGYHDERGELRPEIAAKIQGQHPARAFAIAIPFSIVAALVFARVLGSAPTLEAAFDLALMASGGFVATSFGVNYQFCADRSMVSWAVDSGYHVAQFCIFALVLGLWH